MKNLIYSACFIIAACYSCATKDKTAEDGDVLTVIVGDVPNDAVDISGCVDSLRTIVLQTPENVLIGDIAQILIMDDRVGLLDPRTNSIHFFGLDGTFVNSIMKQGRGPGEYMDVSKILYDKQNGHILAYDAKIRQMLVYDLEGNHIETLENFGDGAPLRDIINLPSGEFLCSRFDWSEGTQKDDLVGVWKTDAEGKFTRYLLHDERVFPAMFSQYTYYLFDSPDGDAGYFDPNTDEVFSYRHDTLYRRIAFEFPEDKTAKDFEGMFLTEERFTSSFTVYRKGGYVFGMWASSEDKPFVTLVSTETGETETGVAFSSLIGDELAGSGMFVPNNSPDILTSILPAGMLLSIITTEGVPEDYKNAARRLVEGKTEEEIADMDPIISLMYIKR